MSALAISSAILASTFGGALAGSLLRRTLPEHHLSSESKDVVRLGIGLVATMTALLLSLLIASAKSSYDADKSTVVQISAKMLTLDRLLGAYGPDAKPAREELRRIAEAARTRMWPVDAPVHSRLDPANSSGEALYKLLLELEPAREDLHTIKGHAMNIALEIGQLRWLLFEQTSSSISMPFLVMTMLWLTLIFISFGLYAPFNATVVCALLASSISVSCAFFLILELDQPFDGLIRISSDLMQQAIEHLGR